MLTSFATTSAQRVFLAGRRLRLEDVRGDELITRFGASPTVRCSSRRTDRARKERLLRQITEEIRLESSVARARILDLLSEGSAI